MDQQYLADTGYSRWPLFFHSAARAGVAQSSSPKAVKRLSHFRLSQLISFLTSGSGYFS